MEAAMCTGPCVLEQHQRPSAGPGSVIHGFLCPFVPGGLLDWFGEEAATVDANK